MSNLLNKPGKPAIILCFIGWLSICVFAQSQPPSPTPSTAVQNQQPQTAPEKQKAENDQTSAKALSSAVDNLASEIAKGNQQAERASRENNTPSNWWVINGTNVFIGLCSALLAWVAYQQWRTYQKQADLMHAALIEARKAANAAKESADATKDSVAMMGVTAERQLRAYLHAWPFFVGSAGNPPRMYSRIRLTNFGQTPAYKVRSHFDIIARPVKIGADFQLPPIYNGWCPSVDLLPNGTLDDDKKLNVVQSAVAPFSTEEINAIVRGDLTIYVFGEVRYEDVFGRERVSNFCAGVNADKGTLITLTSPGTPNSLICNLMVSPMGNTTN